jgi:hypothetical protein
MRHKEASSSTMPPDSEARTLGRLLSSALLLCVGCGLRTPLTDSASANSTSDSDYGSWDGGLLASTPGQVRCGPLTCGQGQECCLRKEGRPASDGCSSPGSSGATACYWRKCDESGDCAAGEFCYWIVLTSPPPTLGSYCVLSPDASAGSGYVACGSDEDCRAVGAPPCVAQRCRGDILQSCGRMPSEKCTP